MKYKNETEIMQMIAEFENGTILEIEWHHAEHLIAANYYLSQNDFETALLKMRQGIFNLLRAFAVDLEKMMPYHETLTVFWMQTVNDFKRQNPDLTMFETCTRLVSEFNKDYPLKFYNHKVLFSEKARKEFVEPDIR